jgi:hypothetical protein
MTLIGKLLSFLNLVVGLGILSWSTLLYVQRPGSFDPASDSPNVENFATFKGQIEKLGEEAKAASSNWGRQRKILEELEGKRAERLKRYDERLKWAREGNPKDNNNGFYEPVYEKDSGLLDLNTVGRPIRGSDNQPLKGSETLLTNFSADVQEVAKLTEQIVAQREKYVALGSDIRLTEDKLLKMIVIREAVQAELFFLSTFEVNVYETRETVLRRKKQLDSRLTELSAK